MTDETDWDSLLVTAERDMQREEEFLDRLLEETATLPERTEVGEPVGDAIAAIVATYRQDCADGRALRLLREALPEPGAVTTWWHEDLNFPPFEATFESDRRSCGEALVTLTRVGHTIAEACDAARKALWGETA